MRDTLAALPRCPLKYHCACFEIWLAHYKFDRPPVKQPGPKQAEESEFEWEIGSREGREGCEESGKINRSFLRRLRAARHPAAQATAHRAALPSVALAVVTGAGGAGCMAWKVASRASSCWIAARVTRSGTALRRVRKLNVRGASRFSR